MNNKNILLKVRNVKKYFDTPSGVIKAIDDVSFDVNQGEIVGLIGESGSGKTTVGRCLIRLYEEYSGFVGLNGQAISGSKLNKKKKMFLNQNMQMIFQDPHASLNGQQNIYTILREPLIVNNIMKQEYNDLFLDWEDVKSNFRFTFKEEFAKIELDTITYHADQANKLLKEWIDVFKRIKFRYEDIENDFNQYFAFKISSQEREGNVISKIFKNNSRILDLYYKSQSEFRNNSILLIEQELKNKKHEYKEALQLSKESEFYVRKRVILSNLRKELKSVESIKSNILSVHGNIINSYIKEFRNSYLSHKEQANSKTNFKEYNDNMKLSLLSKKMAILLSEIKYKIIFLSSEKIDEIINEFKKYRDDFLTDINNKHNPLNANTHEFNLSNTKTYDFSPLNAKTYKRDLKKYININFYFNFEKYLGESKELEIKINNNIDALKAKIERIRWTYPINREIGKKRSATEQDVEEAKIEFDKLNEQYDQQVQEYKISLQDRMNEYYRKIIREQEKLNQIRKELEKVEIQFQEKHKEFINGLREYLTSKGETKKQINNNINIYENKLKTKIETLESFNVEILNLKKDLNKLKHLLGIETSKNSKKYIKKILMKEKIYRSLEEVGLLRQFAWRYPHEFSGGQRQRIVIARALISNPKLIIADEPIASLDVSIQAQVVNILKDLCEKKNVSLIFIAHDLSMVEYIADKILIMHLGKIVEFGKTEEIYANPVHPYTINLFKSIPKIFNANDKFESSNFELTYLEQQTLPNAHVDFYELNENHIIYSTVDQFRQWTNKEPKISKYTKNPNLLK